MFCLLFEGKVHLYLVWQHNPEGWGSSWERHHQGQKHVVWWKIGNVLKWNRETQQLGSCRGNRASEMHLGHFFPFHEQTQGPEMETWMLGDIVPLTLTVDKQFYQKPPSFSDHWGWVSNNILKLSSKYQSVNLCSLALHRTSCTVRAKEHETRGGSSQCNQCSLLKPLWCTKRGSQTEPGEKIMAQCPAPVD